MRVEVQDIRKYFGNVRANDGINLTLEPGKIYGILGENGAGKSTLMKILSGYQSATSGKILLNGDATIFTSPDEALRLGIGMLYQDPMDFPPLMTVENHLLAHDDKFVLNFQRATEEIRSYATRFDFDIDPEAYVDTLTLGERQQMELLRLLALGAELLILDEPTTGISAEQKEMLFGTMRRLAHEEQKTIVLVSHKLEEVQELCDEVAVLRQGKLVGKKTLPSPTSELVRLMFGEEIPRSERTSLVKDNTVIRIENAEIKTYRLTVSDIALDVHEGEVVGLAGLEGSGQKLLLQACAGILPLNTGSIKLDNKEISGKRSPLFWLPWLTWAYLLIRIIWIVINGATIKPGGLVIAGNVALSILVAGLIWLISTVLVSWTSESAYHEFLRAEGAYVPAGRLEEGLVSGLSLTEHMALVQQEQSFMIDWDAAQAEINKRIQRYNVKGEPNSLVEGLSGGNQQRAMLALLNPALRLILLEHPTRGLDVTSTNWVWELFQHRQEKGTAILFMSADLDELLERSDRIAVFSGGVLQNIVSASATSVEELGYLIGGQQA